MAETKKATNKSTNKSTNKKTNKNTNKNTNKSGKTGSSKSNSKNKKKQNNSSDDTMKFLLVLVIAGIAIALIFFSQKDDRSGGITGMPTPTAEAEVTETPANTPASEPTAVPTVTAAPTIEPIQSQPEPENTPAPTAVAEPEPTVVPEPTATTVPTAAPTMEPVGILSAKEAYEVLCAYSKEALHIAKEVKEYDVEYDEQLTLINGADCYRFNLSEFSNGKVRNRGEFFISVDGTKCFYINSETNEFIQAEK